MMLHLDFVVWRRMATVESTHLHVPKTLMSRSQWRTRAIIYSAALVTKTRSMATAKCYFRVRTSSRLLCLQSISRCDKSKKMKSRRVMTKNSHKCCRQRPASTIVNFSSCQPLASRGAAVDDHQGRDSSRREVYSTGVKTTNSSTISR